MKDTFKAAASGIQVLCSAISVWRSKNIALDDTYARCRATAQGAGVVRTLSDAFP